MFVVFLSILIIQLLIILVLCHRYVSRKYDYWKNKQIDFIKPLPFFGCMWPNVSAQTTVGELFAKLYNQMDKDYFGVYVFDRPTFVPKAPNLIKDILLTNFDSFRDRTTTVCNSDVLTSNAVFFKRGPTWKDVRAKLTPAYTSSKLKLLFNLVIKESDLMIDYINRKCVNASSTDAKELCAKYTTNVIGKCTFGINANSFNDDNAEFRKIGQSLFGTRLSTALRQGCIFFLPAVTKRFNIWFFDSKSVKKLRKILTQILKQRMEIEKLEGLYLIDILLDWNRKFGEEEFSQEMIISQSYQFYIAESETVSSSIAFTLYELAINPDVQNTLRKEIQESVKEQGQLTYDALMNLKYFDMVFSEVLRKYPVIAFLDRTCIKDYKIHGTDIVLEKDTPVYIPLFGLHYDPKYFPNPEKFIPERFADKNKINQNGFYYLPFGEGPRNCIGMRFGLMSSKIGIAQILLNYELLPNDQTPATIELDPKAILIASKVGVPIKFEPI